MLQQFQVIAQQVSTALEVLILLHPLTILPQLRRAQIQLEEFVLLDTTAPQQVLILSLVQLELTLMKLDYHLVHHALKGSFAY